MAITKKKEQDGQQNAIPANMQYTAKREAGTPGPGRAPNGQPLQTATAYRNIAQAGTPGPRANMQQLQTVKPSAPQAVNPQTVSQPVSQVQQGGYTAPAYQKSDAVLQAEQLLQQQMNNKPGAYQSTWSNQMNAIMDRIMNREDFSYDLNGDAMRQQYKDMYALQGQQARMDTMGQAAALTGGYGNSYAQTAGQQAYQGYMQQLNERVLELYQLAMDRYNQQGQDLYNQYGMLADKETQDYGRYRDRVVDYYTELDRLADAARYQSEQDYGRYTDQVNRDYGIHRDQVADSQWDKNFAYQQDRDAAEDAYRDKTFDYQVGRDQAEDAYRDKVFDYEAVRDAAEDAYRDKTFDYQVGRDQAEDAYRDKVFDYEAGRDAAEDAYRDKTFDYQVGRDQAEDAYRDKVFDYGVQRDQVADSQWQQEFNLAKSGSGGSTQTTPTINFKSMGYNSYEQMATALKGLAWSSGNKAMLNKLNEYITAGYLDEVTAAALYNQYATDEEPKKQAAKPHSTRTQATK